jgi:hypothetical protein
VGDHPTRNFKKVMGTLTESKSCATVRSSNGRVNLTCGIFVKCWKYSAAVITPGVTELKALGKRGAGAHDLLVVGYS